METTNVATTIWNIFIVLLPTLFLIGAFITWMAWVGGRWRFDPSSRNEKFQETTIRYMFVKFLTEIINDFKHILALLIVLMFVITVGCILYFALFIQNDFATLKDGLQLIVATLGGLVGSIVGYYFGESAASKRGGAADGTDASGGELVQDSGTSTVVEATKPPTLKDA